MTRLLHPGRIIAALTLALSTTILVFAGWRMFSPGALNADSKRGDRGESKIASHAELSGNCSACHAPPWSSQTMADRCLVCHTDVGAQIESKAALHGKLTRARDCRTCHTEHVGAHGTLTSFEHFNHDFAAFKLTGKHVQLECSRCHVENHFKGTTQACAGCHAEPVVHKGKFGVECAACHSTNAWKGAAGHLTAASFDHGKTGFALVGKHAKADCKSCHASGAFVGVSKACVSCHVEPVAHHGKFGVECASCHTPATWKGALLSLKSGSFDHDKTKFKLTGKHQTTDCKACHVNGAFVGTAQTCVSCHAEPVAHHGKFGVECASCHTPETWKGALLSLKPGSFDHDKTKFKLTGKHQTTDCKACHVNGAFVGTAQTCVSCHAEPRTPDVHKSRYGTNCTMCHSTTTFKNATFKHTFPINHGNRRGKEAMAGGNTCATCHTDMLNMAKYTCYNCHVHDPARIARIHANRRIANLQDCAKCHKTGRGGRAELDLPGRDGLLAWLFEGMGGAAE